MYRRPGDLRKSKARKSQIKPFIKDWKALNKHLETILPDQKGRYDEALRRFNKNFRKKAPKAGWESGADKELFHKIRTNKKNQHFMLDMSEWSKWDEMAFQEECERREREECDFYRMEQEMQWMAEDYFYEDDDGHRYDPYEPDDRWWDYPDYEEMNDRGCACDCPECNEKYAAMDRRSEVDKMWDEYREEQTAEEANRIRQLDEMDFDDPDWLAEYYYQRQF